MTVAKEPGHRGERDISVKTTACGNAGRFRCTRCCSCAFYHYNCTRGRGCSGHPAFPTPSLGREIMHSSGASRREVVKPYLMNTSAPNSQPSSPAKAGDPVSQSVNNGIERLRRTGYSAGACHRARRRRDPVAEYDDSLWSSAATQTPSFRGDANGSARSAAR
jgi:hypothetical protein